MSESVEQDHTSIGLFGAISIGVGGMIGAGIFSILGVVGSITGSAAWISFLGAGILALFCAYSFAKLGSAFPSNGGPVEFFLRGLGNNLLSGSFNVMLWLGFIMGLSLYSSAFSGYASALLGIQSLAWAKPVIAVGVIGLFLALNVLGSAAVGKAEGMIVALKLAILLGFAVVTAFSVRPELLSTAHWSPSRAIVVSLGTTFLAYEGFGLITNAAGSMKDPRKTLPRAIFLSIILTMCVYLAVAIVTFGNLSTEQIIEKQEYALAAAAEPALGRIGFTIMSIAALLSTASAINAALFGGANICIQVAHDRQLPEVLDRRVWQGSSVGLYVTAVMVAILAALVPLETIATTGGAAFLLIYAGVCIAHLRLRKQAGGSPAIIWTALIGCLAVFVILLIHLIRTDLASAVGLVGLISVSVLVEWTYRRVTRRSAQLGESGVR